MKTTPDCRPVVLVVDDDPDHALMLELSLDRLGYVIIAAHSCREARAALERHAVDALVSDLTLGDGTAIDLVKGPRTPRVTIVLSGSDDPDDLERCSRAGFNAYLVKPAAAELVATVIRDRLGRHSSSRTMAKVRIDTPPPPPRPGVLPRSCIATRPLDRRGAA